MSNLSPQAQEVFWAFNRAASGKPDDWHYLPAIAAAVRAAGEQCTYVTRTELNLIADELEAFAQ
jgi:tetrahydromethanopterin S-methyltransferase subunit E